MDFLGLENKTFLVFGVANKKSVAYFVGHVLTEQRAQVVYIVQNLEKKETVSKLFPTADIYVCDVEHEEEITRLAQDVGQKHPKIHGIVHSLDFADYEGQIRPFHETK